MTKKVLTLFIGKISNFINLFFCVDDFQIGKKAFEKGDWKTAFEQWKVLAEQGDARAQFHLGVMYGDGTGVNQDHQEAVKWYSFAAEQGDAKAQFNLGIMYEDGTGVNQDYQEAVKWYSLSAEQGDAKA